MNVTKLFLSALIIATGSAQNLLATSTSSGPWDNYLDAAEIIAGAPVSSVFYEHLLKNSANASKALQSNKYCAMLDLNKNDIKSMLIVVGTLLSTYFNDDNFCGTSARARKDNSIDTITLRYCIKVCLALLIESPLLQAASIREGDLRQTKSVDKKLALQSALKGTAAATLSCIYFTPALNHVLTYYKKYQGGKDLSPTAKVFAKSMLLILSSKTIYAIRQYFKERGNQASTADSYLNPEHTPKKHASAGGSSASSYVITHPA